MSLGSADDITLAAAHVSAGASPKLLAEGTDLPTQRRFA
jgi:hypothetical protein